MQGNMQAEDLVKILLDKGLLKSSDLAKALLEMEQTLIPVSIFATELSPLESIVRYMREELNFSVKKVRKTLQKSSSAVNLALRNGQKKKFNFEKSKYKIPIENFTQDKGLSILEIVVSYLKEQDLGVTEIGSILNRDPRTVWTIGDRARRKNGEK